jgi:hypothetical protein
MSSKKGGQIAFVNPRFAIFFQAFSTLLRAGFMLGSALMASSIFFLISDELQPSEFSTLAGVW